MRPTGAPLRGNTVLDSRVGVEELASGIDSLYLSGRATLPKGLWEKLVEAKHAAQALDDGEVLTFGDEPTRVRSAGLGRYAIRLDHRYGAIGVTNSAALPTVRFQPLAEFVHGLGPVAVSEWFEGLVGVAMGPVQLGVSRVDVFADVQGWPLTADDRDRFVCRASRRDTHEDREALTGFEFGRRSGGGVVGRIYDKTLDVERKGTDWWHEKWGDSHQPGSTVMRVELEFGRKVLRQFQLDTPGEVIDATGDLWRYGTQNWLSFRNRSADQTRSRWPVAPAWEVVQAARLKMSTVGVGRTYESKNAHSVRALLPALTGYMAQVAALRGAHDLPEALQCVEQVMREYEALTHVSFAERLEIKRRLLACT